MKYLPGRINKLILFVIFGYYAQLAYPQDNKPTFKYCPPQEEWGGVIEDKPAENVQVISNIVYAKYGDRELKLDLYIPRYRSSQKTPGIIVIHGGGWRNGIKEGSFARISKKLAEAGFISASVEYRLSGEAIDPAAIKDCRAAIQWFKSVAEKYGIDSDAIGVLGGSAGGHLALMMGTSYKSMLFESEGSVSNISSRVQAVVAFAPPTDFISFNTWMKNVGKSTTGVNEFLGVSPDENPGRAKEASPITYIDEDSPPAFLLASFADESVNYEQAIEFLEEYKINHVPAKTFIYSNAPHGFWIYNKWFEESMELTISFFKEVLGN